MATNGSNSASYCSVSDFLDRADKRLLVELVQDSDTAVPASSLSTNGKILAALSDASGWIEAAALKGERYTSADLAGLAGVSAGFMKRMVSDLAMVFLFELRPTERPDDGMAVRMDRALKQLERLASGENVFSLVENAKAGHMDTEEITLNDPDRYKGQVFVCRRLYGQRSDDFYRR